MPARNQLRQETRMEKVGEKQVYWRDVAQRRRKTQQDPSPRARRAIEPARGEMRDATVHGVETCIRVTACRRASAVVVTPFVRDSRATPAGRLLLSWL